MPTGTFGEVLKKTNGAFSAEAITTLEKLYVMVNAHFRHGMTEPFKLKPGETDVVYLTCLASTLPFVSNPMKLPNPVALHAKIKTKGRFRE